MWVSFPNWTKLKQESSQITDSQILETGVTYLIGFVRRGNFIDLGKWDLDNPWKVVAFQRLSPVEA